MKHTTILIMACFFLTSAAEAQNSAKTIGNNSPAINNSGPGDINIIYENFTESLNSRARIQFVADKENDATIKKAAKLVSKGEIQQALNQLKSYLASERRSLRKVAVAKYIEGQIYFSNERFDQANQSFMIALNLEPENCSFRVSNGYSLIAMGRYREAMNLLNDGNADVSTCITSGNRIERANLYLLKARLALENRDQSNMYKFLDRAHREIKVAKTSKSEETWIEPTCMFTDFVRNLSTLRASKWSDNDKCLEKIKQSDAATSSIAVQRFKFYEALPTNKQEALRIGADLRVQWTNSENIYMPAADLTRKRSLRSAFLSDLGMQYLWTADSPETAAALYQEAFDEFEPLINSGRSSITIEFMQLIIRIRHMREMFPSAKKLPSNDRLVDAIFSARDKLYDDRSLLSCEALAQISIASSQLLSASDLDKVQKQSQECYETLATSDSWTGRRAKFEIAKQNLQREITIDGYEKVLEAREAMYAFPGDRTLHADQALDLMIVAFLIRKNGEIPGNEDAYRRTVNRAIQEAMEAFPEGRARIVFSTLLPESTQPPEKLFPIAEQLLNLLIVETEGNTLTNYCIRQVTKISESVSLLSYFLNLNQLELIQKSAHIWHSEMQNSHSCISKKGEDPIIFVEQLAKYRSEYQLAKYITEAHVTSEVKKICQTSTLCKSLIPYKDNSRVLELVFPQ